MNAEGFKANASSQKECYPQSYNEGYVTKSCEPSQSSLASHYQYARNIQGFIKQELECEDYFDCLRDMEGCCQAVFSSYRQGFDEAGNPVFFVSTTGNV